MAKGASPTEAGDECLLIGDLGSLASMPVGGRTMTLPSGVIRLVVRRWRAWEA